MFRLFKPKVRLPRKVLNQINALAKDNKDAKKLRKSFKNIAKKLNDENPDENISAISELAELDDKIAVPCLRKVARKHPHWASRGFAALKYLKIAVEKPKEYGDKAAKDLGQLLKKEKENAVVMAVAAPLSKLAASLSIGDTVENLSLKDKLNCEIVSHLRWLLKKHKDPNVRYIAVRGLGKTEDERAVRPLINALKQPELGESVVNELIEISNAFKGREVSDSYAKALGEIVPHLQRGDHPSVVEDVFHAVLNKKINGAKEIKSYIEQLRLKFVIQLLRSLPPINSKYH